MANVLYYWRPDNYLQDRRFGFGYHLNQNSPVLADVAPGETVWAFTRDRQGRYVIAARLIVKAVTQNARGYRYGKYRVWGDIDRSDYFNVERGRSAESLIRHLGITANASILAQSFQGHRAVRPLGEADHMVVDRFASDLPRLDSARIYPEDEFEARLHLGPDARTVLVRETRAEWQVRARYLYETVDLVRARRHVLWLQQVYSGRCQVCLYDPSDRYGRNLCHGHHIQWLSRGGEDARNNLVLICPNHHAAVHQDDAVFDYADLSFRFSNGLVEPLRLNQHLKRAA